MYEATLLIYAVAIVASCYLGLDAFKHRFLPIAQPLVYFNIVLILMCIVGFIETLTIAHPQWLSQFLQDFRAFLLRPLCVPLWIWTLLEYHQDKKVSPTHKLLLFCFIIPLLTITIAIVHIVGQGFTDPTSTTALISPDTRAGSDYILPALRLYGAIVALSAILLTPYLVKNRQQSQYPRLEATLVIFLTLIPFSFYQLHQRGVLDITLGAPMMIFVLLWGSRQYRLLDALPVALQGLEHKMPN